MRRAESSPVDAVPDGSKTVPELTGEILRRGPQEASRLLAAESPARIAAVLAALPTPKVAALLPRIDGERRDAVLRAATADQRERWLYNREYRAGTVGHLMEPVVALFRPTDTVHEAVNKLRAMVTQAFVSYGYVVNDEGLLVGVLVMREVLLAEPHQRVTEIMVDQPFSLTTGQTIKEVIPFVHTRHYPEYPVCDEAGRLVGLLRGYSLFQAQTLALTAQPGKMVGVGQEERVQTNPWRSLFMRNPWLQINLLSSFVAAGVVGFYEETVSQFVAVAAFLPVMVGQSASTGGQALAVALRGLTLGDLELKHWRRLLNKEALVGLGNGLLVGFTSAIGMYLYASLHGHRHAERLALVMLLAMALSTVVSSVVGAVTPPVMKRLGFDPASAATILVGGVTRVVSLAVFLALAHGLMA